MAHDTSYISSTGRNVMRVVWVVPKPLSYEYFLLLPCGPVAALSRDRLGVKVGLSKCFLFSFKDNPMLCFQSYQVELPTATKWYFNYILLTRFIKLNLRPGDPYGAGNYARSCMAASLYLNNASAFHRLP